MCIRENPLFIVRKYSGRAPFNDTKPIGEYALWVTDEVGSIEIISIEGRHLVSLTPKGPVVVNHMHWAKGEESHVRGGWRFPKIPDRPWEGLRHWKNKSDQVNIQFEENYSCDRTKKEWRNGKIWCGIRKEEGNGERGS